MSEGSLEEIGFYTLEDKRAQGSTVSSPLWRCELILSPACNFRCGYCRPVRKDYRATLSYDEAKGIVDRWADDGLRNIRFSGGEPTLWWGLVDLVSHAKGRGIRRIAVSTNGSAPMKAYMDLIAAGVDDISVSLDACCAATGDRMAGGVAGSWDTVTSNIRELAALTYVTVGVVVTPENLPELNETIRLASDDLGVADIRVISAAQWDRPLGDLLDIPDRILAKHPILRYRLANQRHIRGLEDSDPKRCPLVLDDMAIAGGYHFPCIIYLREWGDPIGAVGDSDMRSVREQRQKWFATTNTHKDPICAANCLDVCVAYNRKATNGEKT